MNETIEKVTKGITPLHRAVYEGAGVETIRTMIADGADVNAKDCNGMTPLHLAAACHPNIEVAKCLVENGADFRTEDNQGHTPWAVATHLAKSEEVILYFLELLTGSKPVKVEGWTPSDSVK